MNEVHEQIVGLIVECFCVSRSDVTPKAQLEDDLEADSLDQVELIMTIEDHFQCEIADERAEKINTVQDCFDYADEHGLRNK